ARAARRADQSAERTGHAWRAAGPRRLRGVLPGPVHARLGGGGAGRPGWQRAAPDGWRGRAARPGRPRGGLGRAGGGLERTVGGAAAPRRRVRQAAALGRSAPAAVADLGQRRRDHVKITGVKLHRYTGSMAFEGPFWEERLVRPVDLYPE